MARKELYPRAEMGQASLPKPGEWPHEMPHTGVASIEDLPDDHPLKIELARVRAKAH